MTRCQFPTLCLVFALLFGFAGRCPATVVSVSGTYTNADPNTILGAGNSAVLTADTTFQFWGPKTWSQNMNLNGFSYTSDTGGGNTITYSGAISGAGNVIWNGGGTTTFQTNASFLYGTTANTFSGTLTLQRGTLALGKTPGLDAVPGPLVIGGGGNQAIVRLDAANQINDNSSITLTGTQPARIWTQGHSDTVGPLALGTDGELDLGTGASIFRFAASGTAAWTAGKQFIVKNWSGSTSGGGSDQVRFGSSAAGLTAAQISQVGFQNPAGLSAGLYRAKMLASGEVVPDTLVTANLPTPWDLTPAAIAARTAVYSVPGRANLTAATTPLRSGMKIDFFGDSITWQNVYISNIATAIAGSSYTKNLGIQLVNRGINGGGVLQVRDGAASGAYDGGTNDAAQGPFDSVLAADQPTVAVIFIGINDVWWRGTSQTTFQQALQDIVTAAQNRGVKPVLATLAVHGENPDGTNADDASIDAFAQITRNVASANSVPLVDLRTAYIDYLQNNNYELKLDGSIVYQSQGILTYDGVHPTDAGNSLLADQISQGIASAVPEPASVLLLAAGGLLLAAGALRRKGR